MKEYGLYESAAVKVQVLKTAVEVSLYRFKMLHVESHLLTFTPFVFTTGCMHAIANRRYCQLKEAAI